MFSELEQKQQSQMSKLEKPTLAENRYTQQSECTSEESLDFGRGFQVKVLPASPPSKFTFNHLDVAPAAELKIRQPQDAKKPSIMLAPEPSNANFLGVDKTNAQKQGSFIDIRISSYPSNSDVDSIRQIPLAETNVAQKSSKNLHSSGKLDGSQLRKSETEPYFVTVNDYQGFSIKTNLVKEEKGFKKQKEKMVPTNQSNSINHLSALAPSKNMRMDASRVINESRITLKDYMFMASTSSKKAAEVKRKELNDSKKMEKSEKSEPSPQASRSVNSAVSNLNIKQRFHQEKYHISNDQMGRVVKESIQLEISAMQEKMQAISEWMEAHEKVDNEELIQLYNIRRELQHYNAKFKESFEQLHSSDCKLFIEGICDMSMVQSEADSDIQMLEQI